MTRRSVVRRTAVLGLGAVGSVLLAVPAAALEAGSVVQDVAEATPVAGVVDPLTAPLGATPDILDPVLEAAGPVVEAAPEPVQQAVAVVTGEQGPAGEEPTVVPTTPQGEAPAPTTPQPPAGTTVLPQSQGAPAVVPGGTGVAAMPSSFTASSSGLEGFGGRGAGFGTAMNPMSLFGAPQVATVPQVDTSLPTPLAITPAGGELADLVPVGVPDGLPGALVAVACTVVAGAVAAHVAALRTRRGTATA